MEAVCSPLGLLFPTPLCFCAGCAAGWGRRAEPGLRSQLRTSCCSAGCRRTCSNGTALSPHTANHSKERKVNFPFFFFFSRFLIHSLPNQGPWLCPADRLCPGVVPCWGHAAVLCAGWPGPAAPPASTAVSDSPQNPKAIWSRARKHLASWTLSNCAMYVNSGSVNLSRLSQCVFIRFSGPVAAKASKSGLVSQRFCRWRTARCKVRAR